MTAETRPDGIGSAPGSAIPGQPQGLNHVAYTTQDTAATTRFYTEILGMELVAAVMDDAIPSTGDPVPYFHSFFRMGDGSTMAFFEAPDLPPPSENSHPAYGVFQHLALQLESTDKVDEWHRWLVANEIDVIGPVDHQIIYSIYFYDPNGIRLELTTVIDPTWNDQPEAAQKSLADWEMVKQRSKESGSGMVKALHDLTTEQSHRASRKD